MSGFRVQELIPSWKLLDGEIRLRTRGGDTSSDGTAGWLQPCCCPRQGCVEQLDLAPHIDLGIKGAEGMDFELFWLQKELVPLTCLCPSFFSQRTKGVDRVAGGGGSNNRGAG